MATNFYFQSGVPGGRTSEQRLIENLITESIKIYGFDVYYLPRTEVNEDTFFADDTLSKFDNALPLEMYLENVDGFGGEGELMSKFGIELRETATFVLVRGRWEDVVGKGRSNSIPLPNRPAEGDLIYLPLTKSYFEVKKVETKDPFYQLGKLYVYKLYCELYQYSSERFDTGIAEVDAIEDQLSQDTDLYGLIQEDGSRLLLDTPAWLDSDTGQLLFEGYTVKGQDVLSDNEDFSSEALEILDFSTINPFGEVVTR
jgi:hypothetical protein